MLLPLQRLLHDLLIAPPVGLRPEGVDGRPLAPVQQAILDAGLIRRPGHFAAQRVQFPHQMALACTADGRVAGHIAHRVQIDGEAQRLQSQPRPGQRRLDAGMAGPDHGNIISSRFISHE